MKLLLFSDLHASGAAAERLVERARAVDLVIGAGDFGNFRRKIEVCLDILRAIDKPAVLVAGNHESTDELARACRGWTSAHVLHGSEVTIDGVSFFGVGGGIPVTPFGAWSYDFTEQEAADLLAHCPTGCVLVSHSPPKGAVDRSWLRQSLGSVAVRSAIERTAPALVVCGHIHECAGKRAEIGPSPIVNAGPRGVEWVLGGRAEPPAANRS
jgi:Icc-related predicted phosphoesterase